MTSHHIVPRICDILSVHYFKHHEVDTAFPDKPNVTFAVYHYITVPIETREMQ